ncbi:putative membrane-associated kinase regulator 3 [Gossypium australe]|uniref:Putative membrane-associated kinase regulator 3 n=1 Tax=Gossypium australe TaxID=47621 RepID=A0A5B6V744_9ROSI|nr:putative membrane-associated kinase regulator 3 [Gossypium australe]
METTQASYNNGDEEDYIDIEVSSSSSNLLFYPITSPPSPQFEFQTCSSFYGEIASTTSPADELFYKGKLLPLNLPPRLQMLQSLLQTEEHCSSMASSSSSGFIGNNLKKSWCRKLKQIKQSTITQKLKSLFNKSGCSYECCCVKASVNTNGSHRRSFSGVIQRSGRGYE